MVLEKTLFESPLDCREIKPVNPKGNQPWIFIGRTDAEAPIFQPPDAKSWLWCWERLKAGGEGDDRGWDDWMTSPTQWTLVWVSSGSWLWTGKPGVLQSRGLQRVRHDWATGLTEVITHPAEVFLSSKCVMNTRFIYIASFVCDVFCFYFKCQKSGKYSVLVCKILKG